MSKDNIDISEFDNFLRDLLADHMNEDGDDGHLKSIVDLFTETNRRLVVVDYLRVLMGRSDDDNSKEFIKMICKSLAFALETEGWPNQWDGCMDEIVKVMMDLTNFEDMEIAAEACEFWLPLAERDDVETLLELHIEKLVETLLRNMVYSPKELEMIGYNPETLERTRDKKSDNGKKGIAKEDSDEESDEEDDYNHQWTLRKCAAASLDSISGVVRQQTMECLISLVHSQLLSTSDPSNEISYILGREAATLALGAVGEHVSHMLEELPDLMKIILNNVTESHPLIQKITCWTVSRLAPWIVVEGKEEQISKADDVEAGEKTYFEWALETMLELMIVDDPDVQEAASSGLAVFEEESKEALVPHLHQIAVAINKALGKYKGKPVKNLYDTIASLGESVGDAMGQEELIPLLLEPLSERWKKVDILDEEMVYLLETVQAVAVPFGASFQPFAPELWSRAYESLLVLLSKKKIPATSEADHYDLIGVCINTLDGIIRAIKEASISLVMECEPPLVEPMTQCMQSKSPVVRQDAFALLGDMAMIHPDFVKLHLAQILPIVYHQLSRQDRGSSLDQTSATNNASWALGEIYVSLKRDMLPYSHAFLPVLLSWVRSYDNEKKRLRDNSAITVGRMGLCCPEIVAQPLPSFLEAWSRALAGTKDDKEKESAIRGMLTIVDLNPRAIHWKFISMMGEIEELPGELDDEFGMLLRRCKEQLGPTWNVQFGNVPFQTASKLQRKYSI